MLARISTVAHMVVVRSSHVLGERGAGHNRPIILRDVST